MPVPHSSRVHSARDRQRHRGSPECAGPVPGRRHRHQPQDGGDRLPEISPPHVPGRERRGPSADGEVRLRRPVRRDRVHPRRAEGVRELRKVTHPRTRVIITYYNYFWEPILRWGERLGMKMPQPQQNWLSHPDIENLLALADYECIRREYKLLLPKRIPLLSTFCNKVLANLPVFWKMSLVQFLVAKEIGVPRPENELSCTVVIPCKNERENIEGAVRRVPRLGRHTEIIFVEGNSSDGTEAEIRRVIAAYPEKDIRLVPQGMGSGKGDAVRKGFEAATGDILLILDADLTVPPEDLPKFFQALASGKGEFITGSRLVYPMEKQAMRFLNTLGNKFFSLAFTYLLEQRFKDTLCGTKALFRKDYERIAAERNYFGEFDPFGDFDLIFGAAQTHPNT